MSSLAILSCSSFDKAVVSNLVMNSSSTAAIESIQFGSSQEIVVKSMGQLAQKGSDEKSGLTVFRYVQNYNGDVRSREHFVFDGSGGVSLKYLNIYDDNAESSLNFWKSKYPEKELIVEKSQVISKHSITHNQSIQVGPKQSLEIKHNKVVTIYWEK